MNIKEYQIKINLPPSLQPLLDLAYSLSWSWSNEVMKIFESIDPKLWESSKHNPMVVLGSLTAEQCARLESDTFFMTRLSYTQSLFNEYMSMPAWYNSKHKIDDSFLVAYFSLEYGLSEALPLYSGGLGILSGDHCKSASDLGIPFIAVGILYRCGYFHQYTNSDGWQQERYGYNQFFSMPLKPALNSKGEEVYVSLPLLDRQLHMKVWKLQVGRIDLLLLDTDLPENLPEDREITHKLYSGDTYMRLKQEIVLGIGGVRALDACGYNPTVCHLNEGHPAFVGIGRANLLVNQGFTPRKAIEIVRKSTLFTTHTPVAAGFDMFSPEQVNDYIKPLLDGQGFNFNQIMALGRSNPFNEKEYFSMAMAGIRMSTYRNGVSKLHGEISREMFHHMWPESLLSMVPIEHVTNGVHLPSYISSDIKMMLFHYLADTWHKSPDQMEVWKDVMNIPPGVVYETKRRLREKLIVFVRNRLKKTLTAQGASAAELLESEDVLRPDVLTIGFARRFATYKRAFLLFTDENRLRDLLLNPERPVQLIIAGKAHPADSEGKELIKKIINIARKPEFRKSIVFIEDYDIEVSRFLTSGVDVWLNTPRRPMEASGTSGMKAAANATLNCSIFDGWWVEGFNGSNGWVIGAGEDYSDHAYQDYVESQDLYHKLEQEIVPLFYAKSRTGLPDEWIYMMKSALSSIPAYFNTSRMVMEYTDNYYIPLHKLYKEFVEGDNAEKYFRWLDNIISHWDSVTVYDTSVEGDNFAMNTSVKSFARLKMDDHLSVEDVCVYTVAEYDGESGKFEQPDFILMQAGSKDEDGSIAYTGEFVLQRAGKLKVAFAAVPSNRFMTNIFEMNKVKWA